MVAGCDAVGVWQGLFLLFVVLQGTFSVQVFEAPDMAKEKKWYLLAEALEVHSPAVVATAIENVGIWVIDNVGRKVNAVDGDVDDIYSRQYALELVADRYGELQNPGPEYSWESERWDVETHPTYTFGWPVEEVPSFKGVDEVRPEKPVLWTRRSREEFVEELKVLGTYTAAAKLHGVSRQNYTKVHKRVTGK